MEEETEKTEHVVLMDNEEGTIVVVLNPEEL